jgi:putative transposase
MKSKAAAFLLADLGVTKTHSRPQVSNDNPFSESRFKTLKYRPEFPARCGSLRDSRQFSPWYNPEHRHHGIALLTPEMVHYGRADAVIAARQEVPNAAYAAHPERFVRKPPVALPRACGRLDQSTPKGGSDRTVATVISGPGCLKIIDTFR